MGSNGEGIKHLACSRGVNSLNMMMMKILALTLNSRRFPSISGFRVSWDSRKEPGHRVLGIWLREHENGDVVEVPVENKPGGRKYKVVTREYMAQGHDGYDALKRGKYLIDDECGQLASKIVRQYLLGKVTLLPVVVSVLTVVIKARSSSID